MTPGKLLHIKLKYYGNSVQAILDRLPTASIIERTDRYSIMLAEVFDDGIVWWILGQGTRIEVLAPNDIKKEIITQLTKSLDRYGQNN